MAADKSVENDGQPHLAVAKDFKFVNADMFGVAVTTKKNGTKNFALTVFETVLLPEIAEGNLAGIRPSRQAVSVLSITVDAARSLNDAIARALADIDSEKKGNEG